MKLFRTTSIQQEYAKCNTEIHVFKRKINLCCSHSKLGNVSIIIWKHQAVWRKKIYRVLKKSYTCIKKENATNTKFQWLKNVRFLEIPYIIHLTKINQPIEFFFNSDGAYACTTDLICQLLNK